MAEKVSRMSDAEKEIMRIVWDAGVSVTSNEILGKLPAGKEWKITTVLTLASRLMEKGVLTSTKNGRTNYYTPAILEEEYLKLETKDFINKTHHGSLKSFFAALLDNENISQEDLDELKKWFSKR